MTALNWITKEAKKLRKEYPKRFASWREYVAQASAIYSKKHKGKSPVGKKHKVSGVKKKTVKKAVKKATPKSSYHKDKNSHNVKISVMSGFKFNDRQIEFLQKEGLNSKGFKYRGKILWGTPILLKETKNGTPVNKFYFETLETANEIAKQLNKGQKFTKVKAKKHF